MVSKEDIALLIQHGEQWRENEERVDAAGKETDTYSYKMPESIRKNASLLDEKLAAIKVCDPAVGSGAFPVGMMSEIVKARDALKTYLTTTPKKNSGKRTQRARRAKKRAHTISSVSALKTRSTAWTSTRARWRSPNCACGSRWWWMKTTYKISNPCRT